MALEIFSLVLRIFSDVEKRINSPLCSEVLLQGRICFHLKLEFRHTILQISKAYGFNNNGSEGKTLIFLAWQIWPNGFPPFTVVRKKSHRTLESCFLRASPINLRAAFHLHTFMNLSTDQQAFHHLLLLLFSRFRVSLSQTFDLILTLCFCFVLWFLFTSPYLVHKYVAKDRVKIRSRLDRNFAKDWLLQRWSTKKHFFTSFDVLIVWQHIEARLDEK